jgi:hypothetical protein
MALADDLDHLAHKVSYSFSQILMTIEREAQPSYGHMRCWRHWFASWTRLFFKRVFLWMRLTN